jgi:putative ABC transport system ATP-binding protein
VGSLKGESLIRLVGVSKTFRLGEIEVQALSEVNMAIARGGFVSVTGSHGSGKSTLLSIIGCISRPSKGRVLICGTDTGRLSDESLALFRERRIGCASSNSSLIPELTALENFELALRLKGETGRGMEEKATGMLGTVGLERKRHLLPHDLTPVESRRLAIAKSMIGDPPLLICDDPTAGLNKGDARLIVALLVEFNSNRGTTIICGSTKTLDGAPGNQVTISGGRVRSQGGSGG